MGDVVKKQSPPNPHFSNPAEAGWRQAGTGSPILLGLTCLTIAVLLALPAEARNADGTLGFLITPNNGIPALVSGGREFSVEALGEAELTLQGAVGEIPVAAAWTARASGRHVAACTLPEGVAPGLYALHAKHASGEDSNARAVAVLPPPGDLYAIAHLSDTHIGSGRHKRPSTAIVGDLIQAINRSGAAFCIVTGDLTDGGEPAQFQDFLKVLDTCTLPTFVCSGNHDREALNYEQFFGPAVYAFAYGRDGYLSFDAKDFVTTPDLGAQPGELETARRSIRAARFSIGFAHRFEASQGMRGQLALFVDDPLDYLLFGHWHRENTDEERGLPWGRTRVSVVPAGIDGKYRIIDVTPQGLLFRPVENGAPVD